MRKAKKATKKRKKAAPKKKTARKAAAKKKVRCAAKTQAGKACKRFTDGKSKYCSVHKK